MEEPMKTGITAPIVVLALLATTAVAASDAIARVSVAATTPGFTVSSTLDGRSELPHRIRWIARPKLPLAQATKGEFLVDGRLAWVEHEPPYVYGEDDGAHLGYLVTSWLTPGKHRFAVRATATGGRKATSLVRARVPAPPAPPAGLAGTWRRPITDTSAAPAPGSPGNPTDTLAPAGAYTMVIDKRQIQMRFPGTFHRPASDDTGEGWIIASDYTAASGMLRAAGPVTFEPFHEQAEAGWWCWQDGPTASYRWSNSNDTLTLTPVGGGDPCGIRGFIWAGEWTRVA